VVGSEPHRLLHSGRGSFICRSCCIVLNHITRGRPSGLLQSSWEEAVKILVESALSGIRTMWLRRIGGGQVATQHVITRLSFRSVRRRLKRFRRSSAVARLRLAGSTPASKMMRQRCSANVRPAGSLSDFRDSLWQLVCAVSPLDETP